MKGILLLNGRPYAGEIEKGEAYVLCCDGAYAWAKDKIVIDENVGDYDSLAYIPEPKPSKIYPSEKNFTDGEIGLFRLIELGCNEIDIYGGGGGRADHFLGNLHLLYAAHERGVKAVMVEENSSSFIASGKVEFGAKKGDTVSVLPFGGNALVKDSFNLFYPLKDLELEYGTCRGISNVVLGDGAYIIVEKGVVLIIENGKVK